MEKGTAISVGWRSEFFPFAGHLIRGRFFSLFASFLIMSGAGGNYIFGIYSQEIKSSIGYDQSTLNLLGFFKVLGANIGITSVLIAEVTLTWFVLLIGSATNFGGVFLIWLAVRGKIASPKIWQMCLYITVGANSQNFPNTGVVVTSVRNFSENRGALLLYIASVIIGFSFGAQFPLMNAIVSELFGLKRYSRLFNCVQLATPIGSYLLNLKVTGMLYDREALKDLSNMGLQRIAGTQLTCMGCHCYNMSVIILAAVTCFGALVSLVLVERTEDFYRSDVYEKFRGKPDHEPTKTELNLS